MNSDEVKKILPEYSCDALSPAEAKEVERFLKECPHCIAEWSSLQEALLTVSTASQPLLPQDKSRQMWQGCLRHIEEKTERERLVKKSADYSSPRVSWFRAPWLGWATLATSFAVLGAVWFSSPSQNAVPSTSNVIASLPDTQNQTEWVSFQTPPQVAAPYINHHALMAFDPFSDRVGTTLVADSAAESAPLRVSTTETVR